MKTIYFIAALLLTPVFAFYLLLCALSPLLVRLKSKKKSDEEEIYIAKDPVHSDYIFRADQISSIFKTKSKFLKVGWGDRKIFLETKNWSSLKLEDFLRAFLGMNQSVLRVEQMNSLPDKLKTIRLSSKQLSGVLQHVESSFYGEPIEKLAGYYEKGDYYKSKLNYNCITNCNNWVNRGLFNVGATNKIWCPLSFLV
jgi:uncharacterized protein (TIGR02117 family)